MKNKYIIKEYDNKSSVTEIDYEVNFYHFNEIKTNSILKIRINLFDIKIYYKRIINNKHFGIKINKIIHE
jgi:hypothetical protein